MLEALVVHSRVAGGPALQLTLAQFVTLTSPCTKSALVWESVKVNVMVAVVEIAPEVSALLAASVAVIVTVGTVVSVLTVNAEVAAFAFPAVSVIAPLLPATEIVAALLGAHVSVYLAGLGKH